MKLRETTLSRANVDNLLLLNIRDVETLISIAATPKGLAAVSKVLGITPDRLLNLVSELKSHNPALQEVEAAGGPLKAMGHRFPTRVGVNGKR